MKAKRKYLLELGNLINHLKGQPYNIKFSYFLAKNRRKIKAEIEALEETIKPSEEWKTYDNERVEIAKHFSDKDQEGNPIIQGPNYRMTEKLTEFNEDINKLKNKYENVVAERQKQIDDYTKLLDEEVEFDGYTIELSDFPQQLDAASLEVFMNVTLIDD